MKIITSLIILILYNSMAYSDDIDLDELGWPRDVKFKKGVITIYQPQIESFEKDKIEARAALAVKPGNKSPVFGAFWFTSRVLTDRDEHLVTFDDITVETLKFPEGDEEQVEKLRKA